MIPQVRGFQGCYLDNHRNNWRCARAARALCENAPYVCGQRLWIYVGSAHATEVFHHLFTDPDLLWLWEGGMYTSFVAKALALPRGHFGRGYRPGRSGWTRPHTSRAAQVLPQWAHPEGAPSEARACRPAGPRTRVIRRAPVCRRRRCWR